MAAQKRYREKHAEEINERKRATYRKDPKKHAARSRAWKKANPEKVKEMMRASNAKQRKGLRAEMVEAYGAACRCCGETEPLFLELDHIHNDGKEDRKTNGYGVKLLARLRKRGWPKDRYQLLCSNCNQGKQRNGGVCPHKSKNRR